MTHTPKQFIPDSTGLDRGTLALLYDPGVFHSDQAFVSIINETSVGAGTLEVQVANTIIYGTVPSLIYVPDSSASDFLVALALPLAQNMIVSDVAAAGNAKVGYIYVTDTGGVTSDFSADAAYLSTAHNINRERPTALPAVDLTIGLPVALAEVRNVAGTSTLRTRDFRTSAQPLSTGLLALKPDTGVSDISSDANWITTQATPVKATFVSSVHENTNESTSNHVTFASKDNDRAISWQWGRDRGHSVLTGGRISSDTTNEGGSIAPRYNTETLVGNTTSFSGRSVTGSPGGTVNFSPRSSRNWSGNSLVIDHRESFKTNKVTFIYIAQIEGAPTNTATFGERDITIIPDGRI